MHYLLFWLPKCMQLSPVNAEHCHNAHCGKLVTDVHHHHSFTHEVAKDPLSVPDQLMDVERHHQQEKQVCDGQIQHVNIRDHLLLAWCHSIDHQTVGQNSNATQNAIDSGEDVHERRDVNDAVRRNGSVHTRKVGGISKFGIAKNVRGVHLFFFFFFFFFSS